MINELLQNLKDENHLEYVYDGKVLMLEYNELESLISHIETNFNTSREEIGNELLIAAYIEALNRVPCEEKDNPVYFKIYELYEVSLGELIEVTFS